jgi:hypothetical protein
VVFGKPEQLPLVSRAAQREHAAQAVACPIGELIPRHASEPTNLARVTVRRRGRVIQVLVWTGHPPEQQSPRRRFRRHDEIPALHAVDDVIERVRGLSPLAGTIAWERLADTIGDRLTRQAAHVARLTPPHDRRRLRDELRGVDTAAPGPHHPHTAGGLALGGPRLLDTHVDVPRRVGWTRLKQKVPVDSRLGLDHRATIVRDAHRRRSYELRQLRLGQTGEGPPDPVLEQQAPRPKP